MQYFCCGPVHNGSNFLHLAIFLHIRVTVDVGTQRIPHFESMVDTVTKRQQASFTVGNDRLELNISKVSILLQGDYSFNTMVNGKCPPRVHQPSMAMSSQQLSHTGSEYDNCDICPPI